MHNKLFEPPSGRTGLDARLKLMALGALLALVLSSRGVEFPLLVIAISLLVPMFIKVSWRLMLLRLIEPMFIVVVLVALKSLSGTEPLSEFPIMGHRVVIYYDGLMDGVGLALRIMAAMGAVTAVSLTTPFPEFLGALSWLKVPGPFVEVSLFAYRYMRNLFDDAHVIYSSQRIRLGYSSPRRALGSFGALAGSLLIKAFDQAEATAASLHQRGYDGTIPLYESRPFRTGEALSALLFTTVMFALWVIWRG